MRLEDLHDLRALRAIARNPWQVVRFRKTGRKGRQLLVEMRQGTPLLLRGGRADFHMFHRIFLRDEYRLATLATPLECVIDLGANVGLFSARVAGIAKRVLAYEPFPEHFALLERNLAGHPNVEAVDAAVSDRSAELRLYLPQNPGQSGTHSFFPESGGYMSDCFVEVPAITLDELFRRHCVEVCDLLKLDVEGSEYAILHGASPGTLARVRRIHGEYHDVARGDPRTRIEALARFLRGAGFELELVPHRRKPNHGHFFATRARPAQA